MMVGRRATDRRARLKTVARPGKEAISELAFVSCHDPGGRPRSDRLVVEKAVAGFDPGNGRLLWSHPHENRGGDITIHADLESCRQDPVFQRRISGWQPALELHSTWRRHFVKEFWFHRQLRVHHCNAMRIGDYVYAANGDFGGTLYTCMNINTGEIMWRERKMVRANALMVARSRCCSMKMAPSTLSSSRRRASR